MTHIGKILRQLEPGTPSPSGDILSSWKRGEISFEDYKTHSAAWVCENLHQYRPQAYPAIGDTLWAYVRARAGGNRDLDQCLSKKLGTWTNALVTLRVQNEADEKLLLWAAETCAKAGLAAQAGICLEAVEANMRNQLPYEQFMLALKAQALDANARQSIMRVMR